MSVESIERLIIAEAIAPGSVAQARKNLTLALMSGVLEPPDHMSVSEAIAHLTRDASPHPDAAAYILRFLSIPSLIPKADTVNQLARHVVALCEKSLPDLCQYLNLDDKKQTFEKFDVLRSTHRRVCDYLAALAMAPTDLELLVANKQSFFQALNNSIVRSYCSPFGIAQVRAGVEGIIAKFEKLTASTVNITFDLRDATETILSQRAFCETKCNFLTEAYFKAFLSTATSALTKFADAARGRFFTSVTHRLPPNNLLRKRYPLHEEGWEPAIAIPLRNEGPGLAIAVRISIKSDSQQVCFARHELLLGDIPPGDFSATFEALVVAPCSGLNALVTASWDQTGDTERKYLTFEVQIAPQKEDINWSVLASLHPYSTDVAKGATFVGRSEKVLALGNKLLRSGSRICQSQRENGLIRLPLHPLGRYGV
jgi:hypothetical protein